MKICVLVCFVLGIVSFSEQFNVVGYVPEYRFGSIDWAAISRHLTHVVLFSVEPSATGSIEMTSRLPSSSSLSPLRNGNVKVLVCLGGAQRSTHFAEAVGTPELRKVFAENIRKLLTERDYDGVDFNWEMPNDNHEWENFSEFLVLLRNVL
ncbi:Glycosyl hydrolases family 18 [Pelomyxa schiedti]|nr:Glycosyl hydrolases family 18 [Pelomyxa schiedti]